VLLLPVAPWTLRLVHRVVARGPQGEPARCGLPVPPLFPALGSGARRTPQEISAVRIQGPGATCRQALGLPRAAVRWLWTSLHCQDGPPRRAVPSSTSRPPHDHCPAVRPLGTPHHPSTACRWRWDADPRRNAVGRPARGRALPIYPAYRKLLHLAAGAGAAQRRHEHAELVDERGKKLLEQGGASLPGADRPIHGRHRRDHPQRPLSLFFTGRRAGEMAPDLICVFNSGGEQQVIVPFPTGYVGGVQVRSRRRSRG